MRSEGTFTVSGFTPVPVAPDAEPVTTALEVGGATMVKHYTGAVTGRSTTLFSSAFDPERGVGTYVAVESFEGSLDGRTGTFNFVHGGSTRGDDRFDEHFALVPDSGTGELAGITGTGGLAIDADGTHRMWFDHAIG